MKRSFGIGLAAILALAAIAPAAVSQGRAPAAPKLDAKSIEKGKADLPAIITAAGASCNVVNALHLGGSTDSKTKVRTDGYEAACDSGLGLVFVTHSDAASDVYTCLETSRPGADGKPSSLACKLPENLNQSKAVQGFINKAGAACVSTQTRAIGSTKDKVYFEVACEGGKGYVVATSNSPSIDKPIEVTTCLSFAPGGTLSCTLTDAASQLAVVDSLNTAAAKNCTIKDKRYILTSREGGNYFEVACTDGKGYVYEEAMAGGLKRSIDCVQAEFVGGGCTLTDARAAATEEAGLYTRLAKAAGFNCDVAKYGALPAAAPGIDTVELQCSNRPDGAIALFGRDAASSKIYDCVQSEIAGFRCSFTKYGPILPKLTANLKTLGRASCEVSEARVIGATTDEGFVEVACSDGLAGWVLAFNKADMKPKEALTCGMARGIGGGCKLATNVNPKKG